MPLRRFAAVVRTFTWDPSRRDFTRGLLGMAAGTALAPLFDPMSEIAQAKRKGKGKGKGKKKGKKKKDNPPPPPPPPPPPADGCTFRVSNIDEFYAAWDEIVHGANDPHLATLCLGPGTFQLRAADQFHDLYHFGGTIRGAGAEQTILRGSGAQDASILDSSDFYGGLLQDLTMTGGNAFVGGAIDNSVTLRLVNVTIRDNFAEANSGAIYNNTGATLILEGCTITGNSTEGEGGAIWNFGTVQRTNTTISNNHAGVEGTDDCYNAPDFGTGC